MADLYRCRCRCRNRNRGEGWDCSITAAIFLGREWGKRKGKIKRKGIFDFDYTSTSLRAGDRDWDSDDFMGMNRIPGNPLLSLQIPRGRSAFLLYASKTDSSH